ncbi:MAG TPA: hypothetical protein PK323_10520 [Bacteroidia bacterium]|nr:hypothetical protein [Bacteroidia bacterium]
MNYFQFFKVLISFQLFTYPILAQDSVFFRTKKVEVGKVIQIGQGMILFMPDTFKFDQVVVRYRAVRIHSIKYQSGRVDTVWGNPLYQNTAHLMVNYELPHHHELDISIYRIWQKNVLIQYNYYLNKKNFSFTFPLNFNQNNFNFNNSTNVLSPRFSSGIIVRTHSNKQSKFGFYAGLGVLAGFSNKYIYNESNKNYSKFIRKFIHPLINFGYQHYLNSFLYLSINTTFGPSFYPFHRKLDASTFALEARLGFKIK